MSRSLLPLLLLCSLCSAATAPLPDLPQPFADAPVAELGGSSLFAFPGPTCGELGRCFYQWDEGGDRWEVRKDTTNVATDTISGPCGDKCPQSLDYIGTSSATWEKTL